MTVCGNIGILAREKMVNIIRQVVAETPHYRRSFNFIFFEEMFEETFDQLNKAVDNIDVFICGHQHSVLINKWFPNKPLIIVKPLPFDIIHAIREASKIDEMVNVVNTHDFIELDGVKDIFRSDLKITQYNFKNDSELRNILAEIKKNGGKTVVGGTSVNEMAPLYGLEAFYYHSEQGVRQAITDAINLVLLKWEQKMYQDNMNKIMDLSDVGLMVADSYQKIQYINNNALKMLGRSSGNTVGVEVKEILKDMNISKPGEEGTLIFINGEQILCDVIISDSNRLVYRFQQVDQVEKASYKIRRQMLSKPATAKYNFHNIVGKGLHTTIEIARSYALSSDANILIIGPTGSGKELFASSIHNNSVRAREPFIPVNCAALPENLLESELFGYEAGAFTGAKQRGKRGLIELAHKGTLFLDEIGEMPISLQAKLLRVIQEKEVLHVGGETLIPVDIRVIAATNRRLVECINNNTFRPDLYYRLSTLVLEIPALAKRREDIPELIDYYLKDQPMLYLTKQIIKDVVSKVFIDYQWPGNVRELQNVLERIGTYLRYTSKENMSAADLTKDLIVFLQESSANKEEIHNPFDFTDGKPINVKISEEIIENAINSVGGNKTKAAKLLGISRSTLWRYQKTKQ
jgi:propionate catabolism operon transcriptional regulator